MTDWYTELTGTGQQMQQAAAQSAAPQALPEFWDLVPNPASLAPGMPSFLGGKPRKPPANQWDLPPETIQKLLNAGMASQDDEQLADIIKQDVPDAKFYDGGEGRVVVDIQGKKAYLNAPGFSPQDLVRGTTAGTSVALAASPMGAALRGAPYLARVGGAMLAGGAGSAAQDVAANQLGAEKVVDPERLALNVAAGGIAEGILQPMISSAYRFIVSRGRGMYDATAGRLTDAGRRLLQQMGANADEISDDLARQFAENARTAANPGQALRHAEAQSLPIPVQLTRGQITMSPRQQMFEESLSKGTYGEGPSTIMRNAETAQQQALRGNVPAIQERLGRGTGIIEPNAGGFTAQQALIEQRTGLENAVDAGYAAARNAGGRGGFNINAVDDLGARMSQDLAYHYTPGTIPKADDVLTDFGRLSDAARGGFMGGQASSGDANVMVRSMFDWRARATKAAAATSDRAEASAIRSMISNFDDFVERSVDDALFSGDAAAIDAWRTAIASRRQLGQRFEGGDLIETLTKRTHRGGEMQLAVAPEDAAKYIFGASDTGWINKANLNRDLLRMRGMLGADSQAWNALRQEAFLRFARTAEGAYQGGTRLFSGVKFDKAWSDALRNNSSLMNTLFSDEERSLISQFGRVAARVTNPMKGGSNPSGTANALANMMQQMAGNLGPIVGRYFGRVTMLGNPLRQAQAVAASTRARPTVRNAAVGIGPPIGTAGTTIYQDSDRR